MYGRPPMYNPRPYTPTISAPFRPNLMTQPPGFMPQTMGFQPKFRPQMPIPHPIIPQNNNDIYLSVFIGEIPEGITDEFMEQILKLCGNIRSWKRVIDSSGKKKNFGICEFEGFEVLFRALRVLGGEANKELGKDENAGTLELPCDDDQVTMQHILFIIDNSTRSYITKNSKPRNPYDLEKDKECLKSIEEIVKKLVEEKKKAKEEKQKSGDHTKLSDTEKEISKIRDQVLHEEGYDLEYERKRRREDRDYDMARKRDYDSPSSWRNEDIDEEEEEERRRQERREKEMEQAYRERVKRWENREYERMKDYEMDQMDEAEYLERRKKRKRYLYGKISKL
jgi:RNA recognition motif-containing protein